MEGREQERNTKGRKESMKERGDKEDKLIAKVTSWRKKYWKRTEDGTA